MDRIFSLPQHQAGFSVSRIRGQAPWVGQNGPTGFYLSDEAVDWIEEVANRETPQRQGDS
jgi:hypothetical protein